MSLLTATRTTFMSASACCHAPPRFMRCSRSPATVLAESGTSTTSAPVPMSSRRFANKRTFTFTRISPIQLRIRQKVHQIAFTYRVGGRVIDQAIGPRRRGQHRRILRGKKIQPTLRVPFYAQELAPGVGLGPVEVRPRLDNSRFGS